MPLSCLRKIIRNQREEKITRWGEEERERFLVTEGRPGGESMWWSEGRCDFEPRWGATERQQRLGVGVHIGGSGMRAAIGMWRMWRSLSHVSSSVISFARMIVAFEALSGSRDRKASHGEKQGRSSQVMRDLVRSLSHDQRSCSNSEQRPVDYWLLNIVPPCLTQK